ncbi:putative acyltransferase [Chitinophaga skermanii]|uniref:Putative acyltransferase n=1 Tax=Chitinophaga skermanii TaxID=331697 RepID=A0A327R1J4_9BACT|nr:heparan-alpha-glucosaminide N-acetyltransferase domain-containing protein [Chitinophaga skermanii]RAJ10530.1 putative acyltransferase [Chitinophaga skermanii]
MLVNEQPSQSQRFLSLDVFRGLTVALMILVNNPGSWSFVYPPFRHAEWHGYTPTDLVFPFFLFAVGNAMSFALRKYEAIGHAAAVKKILKRTFLIFIIGLLLNWFPFVKYDDGGNFVFKSFESLRIMGVLQRIALCYGIAGLLIHFLKPKGATIAGILLLAGYWLILNFAGQGDPYSLEGNAGLFIDKAILGESHMYHGEGQAFDPEGLLSTLPAVVNVIAGYLVGAYIQQKGKNNKTVGKLLIAGVVLVALAYLWNIEFPINKKIWTSSYVLVTVGLATLVLALLVYVIEIVGVKKGFGFFEVFGKNPLFIYVMSGVLVKTYGLIRPEAGMNAYSWIYKYGFQSWAGDYPGSLLFAIAHVLLFWLLGYVMDKKKIYIRV